MGVRVADEEKLQGQQAVPMMTLVKNKMREKLGQGSVAQGFSTAGVAAEEKKKK